MTAIITEESIAAIWREVLLGAEVGPDSDFFGLGGDSIDMLNIIFRVGEVYGIELVPDAVFENASVRQFTRVVRKIVQERDEPPLQEGSI
jgi:acyl carrier protein